MAEQARIPERPALVATVSDEPIRVLVSLECPSCGDIETIDARLQARATRDTDGNGALALRVRSPKVAHVCGQAKLGLIEGPRER